MNPSMISVTNGLLGAESDTPCPSEKRALMTYRALLYVLSVVALSLSSNAPVPAQASAATQLPKWPQSFDLRGYEVRTYGFGVTQAGPIALDIRAQGAPLDVILQGPSGQPVERQGAGSVHLDSVATPQDVQRGIFWHILVRLTAPAAQAGAQSTGSINVQHPPEDPQAIRRAVDAVKAQRRVPSSEERARSVAASRAQRDALFNARVAAGEQELVQRRASIYQTLQPTVEAMRRQQAEGRAASAQTGINTRAINPERITKTFAVNPVITSLSAAAGVPGDGIIINGSGFGTANGVIHFIIGAMRDLIATPEVWVNNQIFVAVPDPSAPDPSVGAMAYDGVVYIVVGGVKSNLVPFHFAPIIDHRIISIPADFLLGQFADPLVLADGVLRNNLNWAQSAQGDDKFYRNTLLQNGWTVEAMPSAYNSIPKFPGGGIFFVAARVGTNSPYTDVFSWVDTMWQGLGSFQYAIEIPIQGPRGLPDGVVCTSQPVTGQACPNRQ